ncbi:MAG: transglutaminase-like domain-containing protein [Spirochaetes bacterium]|nr:transglutaminase-like domain-containing protein [Spirochaetota bacterium]
MRILFGSRLFLYLLAVSLPLLHPAIVVSYDLPSLILWFILVPWELFLSFFASTYRMKPILHLGFFAVPLVFFPLVFAGWSVQALEMIFIGTGAYGLTALLFRYPDWGRRIAFVEQFGLAVVYIKLLNFFRASEEVLKSPKVHGILSPQVLMGVFLGAFLLHGVILYITLYRERGTRTKVEGGLLLSGCIVLTMVLLLLPPDYVKNTIVTNLLQHEVNPPPEPLDIEGNGFPNGNLQNRRDLPNRGLRIPGSRDGQGRRNRLEGIPQDQWPGTQGRGRQGQEGKQYAVMVVASSHDPLYMANEYRGRLHPVTGFIPLEGEPLNELSHLRLLETWKDVESNFEPKREEVPFFVLSTEGLRYLPYKPYRIEPTVFQRQYRPFLFQYRGISRISRSTPEDWKALPELSPEERAVLEPYLEVPLAKNDLRIFSLHLSNILKGTEGYFQRILAILNGFSTFQYSLGYTEDTSIEALVEFLSVSREGDCTEFSNTAALLARMAGIPSRVVTGYLASSELQTPAHIRGLSLLRQALPPLQAFPLEELFLVTTAHRHSWAQFWIPQYGWIDFETTAFAIPPMGMGDPNNRDVVIPLIQEESPLVPIPTFPWKSVLRILSSLIGFGIFGLYSFRYIREAWYRYLARGNGVQAARALYRLVLLELASEGYPLKPPSLTPFEFTKVLQEKASQEEVALKRFASLYTELCYRSRIPEEEKKEKLKELRSLYASIRKGIRRKGLLPFLVRAFSLRGLRYSW